MPESHGAYVGTIPETYDRCLGPMLFHPYAADLVRRLPPLRSGSVLELACGTGILTRYLRDALPAGVKIFATDLNEAMLDVARTKFRGDEDVVWGTADACCVPFETAAFDAVFCQFGFMFFPDRVRALRECARVLKPGGTLFFNVWDSLDHNEAPRTAHETAGRFFPDNPPSFYLTAFGLHDDEAILAMLAQAGLAQPAILRVNAPGRSESPRDAATGLIEGTPLSIEILARDPAAMPGVVDLLAAEFVRRLGGGPMTIHTQALVCRAIKPAASGQ